jgi:hypothetical protein
MASRKKVAPKFAIGDHVRLASYMANTHPSYLAAGSHIAMAREAVDGLVLSIRELRTGKLSLATVGAPDNYIIEIVYDATFNPRYASPKNAPKTVERAVGSPLWQRLRDTMRKEASEGRTYCTAQGADSPYDKLIDGWKVVKVRSSEVVSLEQEPATSEA